MSTYLEQYNNSIKEMQEISGLLADFRTYDVIRQIAIDFWIETGYDKNLTTTIHDINRKVIRIATANIPYYVNYDTIADKINDIDSTYVNYHMVVSKNYKGFTFTKQDFVRAEIPQKEFDLLIALGKVVLNPGEVIQPSMSIFCPTGEVK